MEVSGFMLNGFGIFGIIFALLFFFVLTIFIVALIRALSQWNKNNHSPLLTVPATVATKRIQVGHHYNYSESTNINSSYTRYFVTFQVESGDRMELSVNGNQYGLLVEGDTGMLCFQGTRFLSFERI